MRYGEQYLICHCSFSKQAYEVFADLYAPVSTLLYASHSFGSEGKILVIFRIYSGYRETSHIQFIMHVVKLKVSSRVLLKQEFILSYQSWIVTF